MTPKPGQKITFTVRTIMLPKHGSPVARSRTYEGTYDAVSDMFVYQSRWLFFRGERREWPRSDIVSWEPLA